MQSVFDFIRDVIGASLLEGRKQKWFLSYVKPSKAENIGVPILSYKEGFHVNDQVACGT